MKLPVRWYDSITMNIYWFALSTRSQTLSPLIVPLLVQNFVGEGIKGSAVGQIRLWALMVAVLVQALMGLVSDHSTARMGRRRPFILVGTLGEILVFALIGVSASLTGETGFWVLFSLYILSAIFSNTAQTATQALIPDLVPESMRGRFSGVKALFEVPLALVFVSIVIGHQVSRGNLWGALATIMAVLAVCAIVTLFVPEKQHSRLEDKIDWQPFVRVFLMTAVFTLVILTMGALVKWFLRQPPASSSWLQVVGPAIVGLIAMVIAVVAGVAGGLRIAIGKEVMKSPSFIWWVINRLAFLVGSTNVATFLLFFLQERFPELDGGKAAGPAATIMMVVGAFILLTALPTGWLADRFGKVKLIGLAGLLAIAGMGVILMVPSMAAIYIGGSIVGIGIGLFYSANWALGTEIVPQEHAGRYLGLSNLAGAGAGAIGAYIGGPIADSQGYTFILGLYTFLFLVSILALAGIKQRQQAL